MVAHVLARVSPACAPGIGRLLTEASSVTFGAALAWVAGLAPEQLRDLQQAALATAVAFSNLFPEEED